MNVAIIPARGGSKRIPKKNIRMFCGQPMIAWSIQTALESHCFDRVLVSTDSKEIAEVAETAGAEVPFLRPKSLSDDYVGTAQVVVHALNELEASGESIDYACCLYATAPFVRVQELRQGLDLLKQSAASYVFTVTSFPFPIQRALKLSKEKGVTMFYPEHEQSRSQDLEEAYHDAGQFYWGKSSAWINRQPIFSSYSIPLRLPRYQVQDIDIEEDWLCAEALFRSMKDRTHTTVQSPHE